MMLAQTWKGQPVAGWWLSVKYDGCRALWDGSALRTRTWRKVMAPDWFTAALPAGVCLDGELWGGNGRFQTVSELVRFNHPTDAAWRRMTFRLFDQPTTAAVPFEIRQGGLTAFANEIVKPVAVRRCEGEADVRRELAAVLRAKGEGLVLKRPTSCYVFGRSSDWLKVKPDGVD